MSLINTGESTVALVRHLLERNDLPATCRPKLDAAHKLLLEVNHKMKEVNELIEEAMVLAVAMENPQ